MEWIYYFLNKFMWLVFKRITGRFLAKESSALAMFYHVHNHQKNIKKCALFSGRKTPSSLSAFTLAEVMIAMTIFTLFALGVTALIIQSMRISQSTRWKNPLLHFNLRYHWKSKNYPSSYFTRPRNTLDHHSNGLFFFARKNWNFFY